MDQPKPKRGAFIVIEGLDRSGKSTQAKLLVERLQKTTKAKLIKFPGRPVFTPDLWLLIAI